MLEATDKVAEEHERNVPLFLLLVKGLRALDEVPRDAAAVEDSIELQAEECETVAGMEHRDVRGPREPALALDLPLEAVAKASRQAGIGRHAVEVHVSLHGAGMPGERASTPEPPEAVSESETA